jgi:hypothetical protein
VLTSWSDRLAATLARYDEALLRKVASRLVKPRNFWPVDDLIGRCVEMLDNPPMLDRRLAELAPASGQLLALIGRSRQPVWALGNAVEMVMALGHTDGLAPVFDLLEAGLLYPVLPPGGEGRLGKLVGFEQWLGTAGTAGLEVFSPPQVLARAISIEVPIEGVAPVPGAQAVQQSDGLEWLLRLGVLWQQVVAAPLRRTMQGGFFKRDLERLEQDAVLNGPAADRLVDVPDLAFLLAGLGEQIGLLQENDGEVRAGGLPAEWDTGLNAALESLYAGLFRVRDWTPLDGWRGAEEKVGNPFPSAYLLSLALLGRLGPGEWARPDDIEAWLLVHHPYWTGESLRPSRAKPWVETFLLGVAYTLRLVEVTRESDGSHRVRLSATGRWLMGQGEAPAPPPVFPRTLLVQPNLEVLAYRQGLTPGLIARLTRFGTWKTLGAACTFQLGPETVYRALETGETFDSICRTLEQHGTRGIPPAVLDLLRTWSNKRDRITVFPAAALLEFSSPDDLNQALARGLPAIRVGETVVVVPSEDQIEFRHFRLTGTRDYALPPERCVTVEPDGVTLTVDLARSDLMLETELPRFAEMIERGGANGKRQYRLTPASLAQAREAGWSMANLETWFSQRAGQAVPPAARLLLTGATSAPPQLRKHLVLHVETEEMADGIEQWPGTRGLIEQRLGPTALAVAPEKLEVLQARLRELGVRVEQEGP